MAQIPTMESGVVAQIDAHSEGKSGDYVGGYFTALTIGGDTVTPSLISRVKGENAQTKCAAFFTTLKIHNNTILEVDLILDTIVFNGKASASVLSALIGAPFKQIKITGKVTADATQGLTTPVLQSVQLTGQIWRTDSGKLDLSDGGPVPYAGTHKLHRFYLSILPDKPTDLLINFGGQANKAWTVSPTSQA
jgi:hypothetical protein